MIWYVTSMCFFVLMREILS